MAVVGGSCGFIVMLVLEVDVKLVVMAVVVNVVDSILVSEGDRWC